MWEFSYTFIIEKSEKTYPTTKIIKLRTEKVNCNKENLYIFFGITLFKFFTSIEEKYTSAKLISNAVLTKIIPNLLSIFF